MEQCKKCAVKETNICPLCDGETEENLRKYCFESCPCFVEKTELLEGVSLESIREQREREESYNKYFEERNRKLYDSIHNFVNSLTDEQVEKALVVLNYCDNINNKIYEMLEERSKR